MDHQKVHVCLCFPVVFSASILNMYVSLGFSAHGSPEAPLKSMFSGLQHMDLQKLIFLHRFTALGMQTAHDYHRPRKCYLINSTNI